MRPHNARRSVLSALGLALCLVPLAGASRSTPGFAPLQLDFPSASLAEGTLQPERLARLRRSSWGGPVTASDGESVTVYVSDAYPVDLAVQQRTAEFLTELYHGSELSSVTVYLAPLTEVHSICTSEAVGCYSRGRIVATGDPLPDGTSAVNVLAHEYGHHVAGSRNNAPWNAALSGPKRWATAAHVCSREAADTAFPGDEGAHYRLNPGEAWAETYRLLNYERQAWPGWTLSPWKVVDESFYPDGAALAAARKDVLQPWRRRPPVAWSGRLQDVAPKGKPARIPPVSRTIVTPLDGDVAIIVPRAPAGMMLSVSTLGGKLLGGTDLRILPIRVCGQRRLRLTVRSKNPGPFRVSYSVP